MMLPAVLIGDTSDHGGRVVSGVENYKVHGIPAACAGDQFDCPIHGINPIVEGAQSRTINDRPIAYEGARTACGASLIASCRSVTVSIQRNAAASAAAVRSAHASGKTGYSEHFEFKDQGSGHPAPEVTYEISSRAGTHQGRSGIEGWSDHTFGDAPKEVELTHAVQTRMGIRE